MKNFYSCFSSYFKNLSAKCFAAGCILLIVSISAGAQDFTAINWGTAKSQPKSTHEVHGEVVKGKLYIFGGYDINKRPVYTPTKRAYVYDPVIDTWTSIASLPHLPSGAGFGGVTHEGLTTDGTDIYFAGGYTSNSDGTGQLFGTKQVWRYNVDSNNYTRLPDLPLELAAGQLRYLNGKIHYVGGANISRADTGIHYALDLNNLSAGWKELAPLINPVNHPGSAVYGGKMYFIGGAHHQDNNTITQNTVEVYNESNNTWTKLADMPVARDHISSAVAVMGDRILVLGGETSHNVLSNLVSAYSPATNTWAALTPLPEGKSAGVAGVLNGNIYYTGGNFSDLNYKGVPEGGVLLSSQITSPAISADSSVAGINAKKPAVYPNPLRSKLNIRFPVNYSGNFRFEISDQAGRTYNLGQMRMQRGGANINFDISKFSLRSGVYFLKIKSEAISNEIKLVIE